MKFTVEPNKELTINKVRMSCDNTDEDDCRIKKSNLPGKNSAVYIVGTPGSGKSNLIYQLLHSKCFFKRFWDNIHIFSPSLHTFEKPFKIQPESLHNEFSIESIEEILEDTDKEEKTLVVFDDFISDINKVGKASIIRKMILNRRHYFCSVWISSQRFNLLDKTLRQNLSHLILFKGITRNELEMVYEELLSGIDKEDFLKLTEFVFKEAHSFLYISLNPIKYYLNFAPIAIEKSEQ